MLKKTKKNINFSIEHQNIFEKYTLLFFVAVSLILFYVIFKDFLTLKYLFFFKDIGSDTVNITLPNYIQSHNLHSNGEGFFKFWTFYRGMGQANGMPINYNPISYLVYFLESIFGLKFWYYRIYYFLLVYVLPIGIFSYFYFRLLGFSKYISFIGGLLFEFSGYLMIGMQWGHANEVLFFIFLLFAFEHFLKRRKRWYLLTFSYVLISSNPYFLAVTSVFMLLYSALRYYECSGGKMKGYLGFMFKYFFVALLGLIINAPRFVFYFTKMFNSPRVSGDVSLSSQLLHHPENIDAYLRNVTTILRFFANDLLGTGDKFVGWYNYLEAPAFYIGLLSLLIFPLSLFYIDKKKRFANALFLIFWLLVAFVPILRHAVNFFIGNYYKISIDIFVPFTFLLFAMKGLSALEKNENINPLLLIISAGVLLVLLHFPYFKNNAVVVDFKMKMIITAIMLVYTVIIYLFISQKIKKSVFFSLLILLMIVEIAYLDFPAANKRDKYTKVEIVGDMAGYNDATIQAIDYIKQQDSSLFYRIEKDYSSGNAEHSSLNDAMAQGYFGTTCYGSFNQLNYIRFLEAVNIIPEGDEGKTRWCIGVRGRPILMTFAGVKYFLTRSENNDLLHTGYDSIARVKGITILKNNYALPLGFVYKKYVLFDDFQKLNDFKKQEALLKAVVLDSNNRYLKKLKKADLLSLQPMESFTVAAYASMIDSLRKNSFQITSFKHKQIEGKIKMKDSGYLFFSIPYDKGWRIYVNGELKKLEKVNIGFTGIYLTKGHYNIVLKYRPLYFELLLFISLFGILVFLLLIYLLNFRKKKQQKDKKILN